MPKGENSISTRFSSAYQPKSNGHPKGVKNRSTIAKMVLAIDVKLPDEAFEKLRTIYPEIKQNMTAEEMMTLIQVSNAITKGDTNAYKAIMDSCYGAPKQDVEISGLKIGKELADETYE
jgi:hypothetical protein